MERRGFVANAITAVVSAAGIRPANAETEDIVIERAVAGTPSHGRVLALVTPHLDDGPIFAGGTLCKLLREGYTGYFIRTSNDEKDSYMRTLGETVLANERDAAEFVKQMGLKGIFDLSYRNHRMDDLARSELRGRLIFLFRLLKVDTVLSYDPWGHYEENPDHYVTAQAVEAACWMSGGHLDLPEHFAAGLQPHSVSEKYYFARGPQQVNRVVDIAQTISAKMAAIRSCKTMIAHMVNDLNDALAERHLRVPTLAGDIESASEEFVKTAFLSRDQALGRKYGLQYAEQFHYIGPDSSMNAYITQHAVPL